MDLPRFSEPATITRTGSSSVISGNAVENGDQIVPAVGHRLLPDPVPQGLGARRQRGCAPRGARSRRPRSWRLTRPCRRRRRRPWGTPGCSRRRRTRAGTVRATMFFPAARGTGSVPTAWWAAASNGSPSGTIGPHAHLGQGFLAPARPARRACSAAVRPGCGPARVCCCGTRGAVAAAPGSRPVLESPAGTAVAAGQRARIGAGLPSGLRLPSSAPPRPGQRADQGRRQEQRDRARTVRRVGDRCHRKASRPADLDRDGRGVCSPPWPRRWRSHRRPSGAGPGCGRAARTVGVAGSDD